MSTVNKLTAFVSYCAEYGKILMLLFGCCLRRTIKVLRFHLSADTKERRTQGGGRIRLMSTMSHSLAHATDLITLQSF
jgi:hypothetical protein